MKRLILLFLAVTFVYSSTATNTDTLKLYRNKCGIKYKKYLWQLYFTKPPHHFGYFPWTKQDKLFNNTVRTSSYIIFFNRLNNKLWEGPVRNGIIEGEVKYFYNNSKVKRIEHHGYEQETYWASEFNWSDAPYEKGVWKYFKRSGRLYKEKQYMTLKSWNDTCYYRVCITYRFNKKQETRVTRTQLIETAKLY